ncbi:MAG: aldo/keto reductase [Actinomycetota bacterium]|nr:aldo/keto reductase [Actinomycetota bacterium]
MRYRALGSVGPEISVIGFGAWEAASGEEWGNARPDQHAIEAIRAGLDAGMNWIDTAEVYGDGHSEEVVGRAISGLPADVLVATKVAPDDEGTGFRAEEVAEACRQSLKRLGRDHIDLYQLHWPDESGVPVEETWGAMSSLVDEGLVRAIGVSNFDRELIERCEAIRHVDSLQAQLSMLHLENAELIRWCGENGTGVVSYGPLAYGLLTGAITKDTTFDASDFRSGNDEWDYWQAMFAPGKIERSLAVVEAMRPVAERLGITVAQLALAWNVSQPGVTAAIAGSRDPEHARSNAGAGDVELDERTLAELDEIVRLGPDFG